LEKLIREKDQELENIGELYGGKISEIVILKDREIEELNENCDKKIAEITDFYRETI